MQPIHYSLLLNALALAAGTALAMAFKEPLLVPLLVLVQTHAIARFGDSRTPGDYDGSGGCGFTDDGD